MVRNCLFLLLITPFILSCNNEKIKFKEASIQKQIGENCEENSCSIIDINYLICEENSPFAENFNKEVESSIISFIYDQEEKPKTIEEAIDFYTKDFKNNYYSESISGNEFTMADSISYISDRLVCLQSQRYSYSGGPHGISVLLYYNFEVPSGKLLTQDELFTDKTAVTKVAERYFREQNNLTPEQDYDEAGFWFEDGFQLPENIGFTKNDMILHYNPYEIAPYSMGAVSLKIPIAQVKQWLTFTTKN